MEHAVEKRLFTVKELSVYLSVPVTTLYWWAGEGTIPSVKIGGKVLFDREDIDRMLDLSKQGRYRQ